MVNETHTTTSMNRWELATGLSTHTITDEWYVRAVDEFRQGFYFLHEGNWIPTSIPGHWQQLPALATHAGKVVYLCHFQAPDYAAHTANGTHLTRIWLRINGVFYWSEAYLNGTSLGKHEGYFEPFEYDITNLLQPENILLIEVDCPDEHHKFNKRMITGVFSHWDCIDPLSNPGGIWLPVELCTSGPIRLKSVRCHSDSCNEQVAQLGYRAEIDTTIAGPVTLRWTIAPRTFDGETQVVYQQRNVPEGTHDIGGLLKIKQPRLWWTWDLGNPDLYTITLEILVDQVVSDRYSFVFGVRQFEMRNWIPYLNGVRFLIKGSNYAPGDMRIATMNLERCEQDLQLVRDCHMNFLRVHAHVDHPAFYSAADAAGILLWQDMPLQWLYQLAILAPAQHQTRAMIRLLYNHPSVVIWCMHNEPVFVTDTADETMLTRIRTYGSTFGFSWNRDVLDTRLKQIAEQEDQHRTVVRSSGELYLPRLKAGTDTHAYFGWYSAYGALAAAERVRARFPSNMRFVTEFGAQSFPNLESCLKFMPAEITRIDFDHLARRHGFQSEVMSKWLPWRKATSLEQLITMTQDYQIHINRYYIDRLRQHKYQPTGGIVSFVFIDPYPAILWSVIDYWRVPKTSYAALRTALSPQYAFTLLAPRAFSIAEAIDLPIYVVNDAHYPVDNMYLLVSLHNPDDDIVARVEHTLSLEADCLAREIDRLRLTPTRRGCYKLSISFTGGTHDMSQVYDVEVV